MRFNPQLTSILEQLYNQTQRKHDCHYSEGQGALFVPEGYALHPQNIIMAVHEQQLVFMTLGANMEFTLRR